MILPRIDRRHALRRRATDLIALVTRGQAPSDLVSGLIANV